MGNIIELKNITKVYGSEIKTEVLHRITLSFEEHSFNSIIGQSGSGKSTLLNIMSTLDKPTSGEVYINGIRTDQMTNREVSKLRNETIGFIFQIHYLLPEFTALENVLMPYKIKNKKLTREVEERAEELIDLMGLSKVKNNNALGMSGGQQQRTAIARALIKDPKIVFADEPTGNLDSDSSEVVYNLMKKINKKFGITFVIITHVQKIAEKTERIIELRDGKIILDVRTKL